MNVLFMCVANSARSQMAEGLARKIFGASVKVESAGSQPSKVNPFAVKALHEWGIDISSHYSKRYEELDRSFTTELQYVITLCAEEVCPTILDPKAKKLHWPLPDPAGKAGSDEEQLARFRETRDALKTRLEAFAAENRLEIQF